MAQNGHPSVVRRVKRTSVLMRCPLLTRSGHWLPDNSALMPAARITVHGGAIFRLIDSKLYK
jgi:hypothetical protein